MSVIRHDQLRAVDEQHDVRVLGRGIRDSTQIRCLPNRLRQRRLERLVRTWQARGTQTRGGADRSEGRDTACTGRCFVSPEV